MFTKEHTQKPQSRNIPKVYPQPNGYINLNIFIQKENKTTTTYNAINLTIFGEKARHKITSEI